MRSGGIPEARKWTILLVSVLVLPVPAPATINRGICGDSAALFCSGFSFGIMDSISNFFGKPDRAYRPLIVALFLGAVAVVPGATIYQSNQSIQYGLLGNPSPPEALIRTAFGAVIDTAAFPGESPVAMSNAMAGVQGLPIAMVNGGVAADSAISAAVVRDPGQPIGLPPGVQYQSSVGRTWTMSIYTVSRGDTLSRIANHFNILIKDIMLANPNLNKSLRAGEKINISSWTNAPVSSGNLPDYNTYFIMPSQGYDWGNLQNDNSIEISNSCGTPVVAAADGVVVPDPAISDSQGAWNGGYGNFVLLEHAFGNGIRTRYAHLEQALVQPGDFVKQGQQIGLMGESGGVNGCELDFQVIGARNPFQR